MDYFTVSRTSNEAERNAMPVNKCIRFLLTKAPPFTRKTINLIKSKTPAKRKIIGNTVYTIYSMLIYPLNIK